MPLVVRAAVVAAVFLLSLAVPRVALASMGSCDEPLSSTTEMLSVDESTEAGSLGAGSLEAGSCKMRIVIDGDEVPICLLVAASAVAPRIIHATSDARIEAVPKRCQSIEDADQLTAPGEDQQMKRPRVAPHAALPGTIALPTAEPLLILDTIRDDATPSAGVDTGVYRPPRN
jgi:hypothetical protein